MPIKSKKQWKYLAANRPDLLHKWQKEAPREYETLPKEAAYYLHKGFMDELQKKAEQVSVVKMLGQLNKPSELSKGLQTIPRPIKLKTETPKLKEQTTAINY